MMRAALNSEWSVPACIHRIGYVAPNTATGASNTRGWFHKLVVGCALAGVRPTMDPTWCVNLAPADTVARAFIDLSLYHERMGAPNAPREAAVYHLLNAEGSTPVDVVFGAEGMPLMREVASHTEWFDAISASGEENPLCTLMPWFAAKMPSDPSIVATRTVSVLRTISKVWHDGSGGWAQPSAEALHQHVVWLRRQGILPT